MTVVELGWDLRRGSGHAVLGADADVTVVVRCPRARGAARRGDVVTVPGGELVRVELDLVDDR